MSLTFSAFLFMINLNKILSSDTGKRGANPPRYRRCKVEHLTVATGKLGRRQMYGSQVRISAGCAVQGAADYGELCSCHGRDLSFLCTAVQKERRLFI